MVEMLVVIGIIAVLATIVVVSVNASRRKALSVKCVSNLRTIYTAVVQYSADHDGQIPCNRDPGDPPREAWGDEVAPGYIDLPAHMNTYIPERTFLCPVNEIQYPTEGYFKSDIGTSYWLVSTNRFLNLDQSGGGSDMAGTRFLDEVANWHEGGSHALFFDGHVERVK